MRKLLLILCSSLALLAPAMAQTKVAVVDVDKVLEEYYKTKEAKIKIDQMTKAVQDKIKSQQDRGMAMLDEIQKLQQNARNMQPDDPQAAQMKVEFDKKVRAVKAHSENLEKSKKDLASKLQKQVSKLNEGILLEVCEYIKKYGADNGYDFVFNQSKTNPGSSSVMFVRNSTDITDPVVKALNASKPN